MIYPTIKGTIFEIVHSTRKNKKDPTKEYDVYTITLEVKGSKTTEFPQLESFGMDLSLYSKLDNVEIDYELCGFRWKKEDGTYKVINRTSIKDIKYADIETKKKHINPDVNTDIDYSKHMVKIEDTGIPEMDDDNDPLPF